jgi:hypothetical protein
MTAPERDPLPKGEGCWRGFRWRTAKLCVLLGFDTSSPQSFALMRQPRVFLFRRGEFFFYPQQLLSISPKVACHSWYSIRDYLDRSPSQLLICCQAK